MPQHIGLYLLCSQPSRVPLEGGLACLVSLHIATHWLCYEMLAFMYLFSLVSRMLKWYACSEVIQPDTLGSFLLSIYKSARVVHR
jgi:hypothetical protein